ncbi:hypothetical protein LSTR_LSTR001646 [Laodelphax striatellus]|uniref:Uncharacterized protein n=1 Tax=Laodelphax striatellus TaxID=195883 RepID=A0A482XBP1_LAOST|nr:hypothetical protein LSTR_LSTR001646 [Laodelphax striatellus]
MIMAPPHFPAQRRPPNNNAIPPYGIEDGLDALINYTTKGGMDERLFTVTSYDRRLWITLVGPESMSTSTPRNGRITTWKVSMPNSSVRLE